jgi:hypothetical protein
VRETRADEYLGRRQPGDSESHRRDSRTPGEHASASAHGASRCRIDVRSCGTDSASRVDAESRCAAAFVTPCMSRTHGTFGLFNPSVSEAGIVADTLAALYNLQLATRSHAPAHRGASFRIRLGPARRFQAVACLSTDTMKAAYWPATMRDGCGDLELLRGNAPAALPFEPSRSYPIDSIG